MTRIKLLIGLLLSLSICAEAQRTKLTWKEYQAKHDFACAAVPLPTRYSREEVEYSNGKVIRTTMKIYEAESDTKSRSTYSTEGENPNHQIKITIGDFVYLKLGNKPWEKLPIWHGDSVTESEIEFLGTDQYWIEDKVVPEGKLRIIGTSIEQKINGVRGIKEETLTIDSSGRCLETIRTYSILPSKIVVRRITESTVNDPLIKIEPPIE